MGWLSLTEQTAFIHMSGLNASPSHGAFVMQAKFTLTKFSEESEAVQTVFPQQNTDNLGREGG